MKLLAISCDEIYMPINVRFVTAIKPFQERVNGKGLYHRVKKILFSQDGKLPYLLTRQSFNLLVQGFLRLYPAENLVMNPNKKIRVSGKDIFIMDEIMETLQHHGHYHKLSQIFCQLISNFPEETTNMIRRTHLFNPDMTENNKHGFLFGILPFLTYDKAIEIMTKISCHDFDLADFLCVFLPDEIKLGLWPEIGY